MNQLDKHCITINKSSNLRVGKHVSKTSFYPQSTEQHLDSRASWIVVLGMPLPWMKKYMPELIHNPVNKLFLFSCVFWNFPGIWSSPVFLCVFWATQGSVRCEPFCNTGSPSLIFINMSFSGCVQLLHLGPLIQFYCTSIYRGGNPLLTIS